MHSAPSTAPSAPGSPSPFDLPSLPAALAPVLWVFALGAGVRTRAWAHEMLARLEVLQDDGRRHTLEQVRAAMEALARAQWLIEHPHRVGYWRVHPGALSQVYPALLRWKPFERLWRALCEQEKVPAELRSGGFASFQNLDAAVALTRLAVLGGRPPSELRTLERACTWGLSWEDVLERALHDPLDETLLTLLHTHLQVQVLADRLHLLQDRWLPPTGLPVVAQIHELLQQAAGDPDLMREFLDTGLCLRLAEHHAQRGDWIEAHACLRPLTTEDAARWQQHDRAIDALALFRAGRWPEAVEAFESILDALRTLTGKRKSLLPRAFLIPLALARMARPDPAEWRQALKLALSEDGRRSPAPDSDWGTIGLAIQMRLGEARRDLSVFRPMSRTPHVQTLDFTRWLMRAWLHDPQHRGEDELGEDALRAADLLRNRLRQCGLSDLATQLDGALAVLQGREAPAHFFVGAPAERWRTTLVALQALEALAPRPVGTTVVESQTRLLWALEIDRSGRLLDVTPLEQKSGVRGWSKPKAVPLSRLVRAEGLDPRDAAVARAVRAVPQERTHRIDLAAAIVSLVGHPRVGLTESPELFITLEEAPARLDVQRLEHELLVRLDPLPCDLLQADTLEGLRFGRPPGAQELKEREALRALTLQRHGPTDWRLTRLDTEQRRVAQLIGHELRVPIAAAEELQPVLERLGQHFQIHSDQQVEHARLVEADPRLRAELTPQGDGLRVRLVVTPLGDKGPRLAPGQGRAAVVASVEGETLTAQRRLEAERSHLETVQDACPMLGPLPEQAPALWDVESPEEALALLERLHTLNAVQALDWPQGKALRVDSAGLGQLQVNVTSGSEWLALQGGITINEQLVASLDRLLDWGAHQKSRFVPLGEGRFLALTEELRQRMEELATVVQIPGSPGGGRLRKGEPARAVLPPVASAWLDRTLAGADVQADTAFRLQLDRLAESQQFQPELPRTLQARLRPYQEEGYQWAMRLAACGLGACLADDMGLGKTLQALGVLLARAPDGPALVIAPTSLIGNWREEARRFAPSLRVQGYAEGDESGDRQALVDRVGAQDLVLVSYQLALNDSAILARRAWHTLVLDEAQAIKNATAKRSQAVFDLQADFRLALSGTPIENRLSELWSIMRVCNPGLLGSLKLFNLRFAVPIERDRHKGAQRTLRKLIAPFILRRTKSQVLDDLPPRTELTLVVEGDDTERAHYEALRRQALRDAERALKADTPGQAHLNILAQLTRLRRAACDPRLITPDLKAAGAKVRAFGELAAELTANGHKTLVFSQFVDFLGLLRDPLDAAGIRYQYLDGSTPAAERSRRVAAFQAGDGDLFLISLKAGGFGLNLTVADYVVIADPWWNPAAEDQASGRAHRIGQQRPVTVYRLVHKGTLEEKIVALHQDKRELADSVLEGHDTTGPLQAEDLVNLMLGD